MVCLSVTEQVASLLSVREILDFSIDIGIYYLLGKGGGVCIALGFRDWVTINDEVFATNQ